MDFAEYLFQGLWKEFFLFVRRQDGKGPPWFQGMKTLLDHVQLEAAFAAQTAMVHAWRKFPFLDHDLPQPLLPKRWPQARAHALFHERHRRWHAQAQDYFNGLER